MLFAALVIATLVPTDAEEWSFRPSRYEHLPGCYVPDAPRYAVDAEAPRATDAMLTLLVETRDPDEYWRAEWYLRRCGPCIVDRLLDRYASSDGPERERLVVLLEWFAFSAYVRVKDPDLREEIRARLLVDFPEHPYRSGRALSYVGSRP
ncbi:MAG: hypothetical protein KDC38_16655, partial [Planctomycetes bacterium]|nr:hypothetical protein [Planctomycetota bacterium]